MGMNSMGRMIRRNDSRETLVSVSYYDKERDMIITRFISDCGHCPYYKCDRSTYDDAYCEKKRGYLTNEYGVPMECELHKLKEKW